MKTVFLALTVVFAFIIITSGISVVAETDSAATLMVLMKFLTEEELEKYNMIKNILNQ